MVKLLLFKLLGGVVMSFRKNLTRQSVYHSVFIFTIIYFILMYFQKRILLGLFQTQLSFSIPNIIALITSDNTLDELVSRGINGAILTGCFLIIEILLFIILIIHFLCKLWRVHYIEQLRKFDFLLVLGLLILLVGSLYYAYVLGTTSLDTYDTISTSLNRVTPKQLQLLSEKWKDFIFNYQFSLGYLPRDVSMVIDHIKQLISNVKEISQIPDVINHYLNQLSQFKFHYFLLMCSGFATLLISQLFEYRLILKSFKEFKIKKKAEKIERKQQEQVPKTEMIPTEVTTTDQLTKILVEQQELMAKIIDLQSDMQENMKK